MWRALAEVRDLMRTPLEGIFRDIVMIENGRVTICAITNLRSDKQYTTRPDSMDAANGATCSKSCSVYPRRAETANIASRTPTSPTIELSGKVNSNGRCD